MTTAALVDQQQHLRGSQLLLVFLGLQLALFLSFLDSTSVSTAAPIIGQDLGASSSITWVGTSFLVRRFVDCSPKRCSSASDP